MKIISNKYISIPESSVMNDVHEITVEYKFLFWKYRVTYRKRNKRIFVYKNGNYRIMGAFESIDIDSLFDFNPHPEKQ